MRQGTGRDGFTAPGETGHRLCALLRIVLPLCIAATVVFIFSNSAQVAEVSSSRSGPATNLLNRILGQLGVTAEISEHLVRKLGHICEYALLGLWLVPTLRVYTSRVPPFLGWALLFGLLTAVGDELFQLTVPGRSGQVSDVAIDFGGVLLGTLLGWLLCLLADRLAARGRKRLNQ